MILILSACSGLGAHRPVQKVRTAQEQSPWPRELDDPANRFCTPDYTPADGEVLPDANKTQCTPADDCDSDWDAFNKQRQYRCKQKL